MTTLTEPIARLLSRDRPLILDGGLATELEAQGHVLDSRLWSARLLLDNPRTIVDAHRAYLEAGANCIISASYQATRSGLMSLGLNADQAQALVVESVDLAKTARDEFLRDQPGVEFTPLVAASIGPYGAPLGDGSEYSGDYGVDDRDLREFHEQRLAWLDASGADVLACETIPSRQESLVLCELLKHVSTPAWVSFSCKDGRHCNDGTPLAECAVAFRDHPRVFAVGVNCTSPQYVDSLIGEINSAATGLAIVVYPNSGEHYEASDNSWHGTSSPVECGAAAIGWRAAGAAIIGGCCRMGPDHIREIARAFAPGRETL
jgi:homocysteine S-methyltransferase